MQRSFDTKEINKKRFCSFFVKELNETGLYVSTLDKDSIYKSSSNPQGFFRLVLYPNEGQVLCHEVPNGYYLFGECMVINDMPRNINRKVELIKKRYSQLHLPFAYMPCKDIAGLHEREARNGKHADSGNGL